MLSSTLASSKRRLQAEHSSLIDSALNKQSVRSQALEEARARRAREKEAASAQRAASHERLLHEEEQLFLTREKGGGVLFSSELRVTALACASLHDSGASKNIRRRADKILLPSSAKAELENQPGFVKGSPSFAITANGKTTHAGLLGFGAPDQQIGLPPSILENLNIDDADVGKIQGVQVHVQYVRLPKGQSAKFQPVQAGFEERVSGGDVEAALQTELLTRCTLTAGDTLHVPSSEGATLTVRVVGAEPESAVQVVDVDLEAIVLPSEEAEAAMEAARRREAALEEARRAFEAAHPPPPSKPAPAKMQAATPESDEQQAPQPSAEERRRAALEALEKRR
uniref:Ubiquitin fusion degradation protein UFD1 N-terminal subdomain 1 domain-containing protein n=1 Tax=Pycnococcus provasolii TaxID=41880 RepID=A0A7S2YXW8_9CHLO|mmetsp:Transcript_369/g.886  ORF Transcript_369/g.886 Transcript_369/m.886 type:complete len:341 (+) Transcript_369:94-1116(+)